MKITPLVLHAGLILPRHTSIFSDALAVSSIVVTDGASVVLTTSAAHGIPVGGAIAVSITDADTPNPITAATVNGDGDIVITTQYAHSLTTTPNPALFDAWSVLAKIVGFTSASINGNRQVVDVPDRNTVVITPGAAVSGTITLTGNEALHERLEQEIVGWHKVTATGANTLSFATPPAVNRTYTVQNPVVVRNIRIFGAVDADAALAHYTAGDGELTLRDPVMFILPQPVDRDGGKAYMTGGSDNRFMVSDGFIVFVLIPGHQTSAHVGAIDMAQGEIYRAVMRTFHGLKVSRSEYADPGDYQAVFERHAGARAIVGNRAIYGHEYAFSMPAEISSCDGVSPFQWSQIDDDAIAGGTIPGSIYPADPPPFRDLNISGIIHHGHPSPLTSTVTLEDA